MTTSKKRRILVIDDQVSIHEDYRKIITPKTTDYSGLVAAEEELFGNLASDPDFVTPDIYEIDSAYQGADAVGMVEQALAEGRPFAVAFVDIRMPPGWDGIKTIRKLWEIDPELLVVICSAFSDYRWEDIVRELGRTDRFLFLRKPFENMEVQQCAAALTERWVISRTDVLTGLLNRRAFQECLHREWTHAARQNSPLCCVMLDIDYFKMVNDRFGHDAGDAVLKAISAEISSHKRPTDTVCRYGGEEICILMPNTDEQSGCQWAEDLRQKIANLVLHVDDVTLRITASFGVSVSSPATVGVNQLVKEADLALRRAKEGGRDRVVCETEHASTAGAQRLREYSSLFDDVAARDIMSSHVVCVVDEMNVGQAVGLLLQSGLNCVPVVNKTGELVGIVSEKDVMEALGSETGWSASVGSLMTTRVIQYSPDVSARMIFDFMCRVQLRRVMVVEAGKPIGVISRGSFLRWIRNLMQTEGQSQAELDLRPELLRTAESLAARANRLRHDVEACDDEVIQPIVCGVSSIEMLLGDLLMWAGCSRKKRGGEKIAECI
jgi:two-component system cell cycle response regulator